jgi:7-carboxy-7-deazaguanine synthase
MSTLARPSEDHVLRLSEIYPSVQGEGPRVGTPTTFVRFAGCNLRCPLWPCDTQHAIDPDKYRDEWKRYSADTLFEVLARSPWPHNICLTGGEPFIQKHDELRKFVRLLKLNGYQVECFSNGTILYPEWALEDINFVMDWKLLGAGDPTEVQQGSRASNLAKFIGKFGRPGQVVKFTISDYADYMQALTFWHAELRRYKHIQVYAGVVWGKLSNDSLVRWMLDDKLPWKLNVQVHNHIWDRSQRAI